MRIRAPLVAAVLAATLALTASAGATVTRLRLTSPVAPGSNATLVVRVSPVATCSTTVSYKSGPSRAAGLYPKRGATMVDVRPPRLLTRFVVARERWGSAGLEAGADAVRPWPSRAAKQA